MQKEVFCPEFSRLWLWFLCGPSLKMCCPFLPVTSPHCDMRPRGGGNSKDNHKDGQAAVGQTGGKIYGKGSWLPAASLEIRSKRLRKLCFSWHAFLSRTSSPRAPLCCCLQGISACTADVWGSPAFFTRLFFLSRTSIHRGSALRLHGHGYFSGTSKLGQQLPHVVLCLPGEAGCVVPATSRRDCKGTKWASLAPGGLGRLLKHLPWFLCFCPFFLHQLTRRHILTLIQFVNLL